MPIERHPHFHVSAEGGLGEKKDSWSIVMDSDCGRVWVEHRWHHTNPYSGITTSQGETLETIDEFRKTNDGWRLRKKLEAALKDAGIDPKLYEPQKHRAKPQGLVPVSSNSQPAEPQQGPAEPPQNGN